MNILFVTDGIGNASKFTLDILKQNPGLNQFIKLAVIESREEAESYGIKGFPAMQNKKGVIKYGNDVIKTLKDFVSKMTPRESIAGTTDSGFGGEKIDQEVSFDVPENIKGHEDFKIPEDDEYDAKDKSIDELLAQQENERKLFDSNCSTLKLG